MNGQMHKLRDETKDPELRRRIENTYLFQVEEFAHAWRILGFSIAKEGSKILKQLRASFAKHPPKNGLF